MGSKQSWKDDPYRKVLRDDILSGAIRPDMKAAAAQKTREEYVSMGALFASRLKGMRSIVAREASAAEKKDRWDKKNEVRQLLQDDVVAGSGLTEKAIPGAIPIPTTMNWKDAQKLRPEYEKMDTSLFKSRLKGMQEMVDAGLARAKEDAAALARDRQRHPRPVHNHRGEIQWVDSDAKALLVLDIDEGKHLTMKPAELHQSRELYQLQCPLLSVFRGHLDQELQTRKWRAQWTDGKKEYAIVSPPWNN